MSIASIGGVVLLVMIHGPGTGAEILDKFEVLGNSSCAAVDILAANDTVRRAHGNHVVMLFSSTVWLTLHVLGA